MKAPLTSEQYSRTTKRERRYIVTQNTALRPGPPGQERMRIDERRTPNLSSWGLNNCKNYLRELGGQLSWMPR
eukprot:9492978-Pyramimonas_sp.AAC.1